MEQNLCVLLHELEQKLMQSLERLALAVAADVRKLDRAIGGLVNDVGVLERLYDDCRAEIRNCQRRV